MTAQQQQSKTLAPTTRVFVTGFGKAKAEALRTHFEAAGEVTDVALPKGRRLAFVGYKTSDAAARAVATLDRTFLGGAKLSVKAAAEKKESAVVVEKKESGSSSSSEQRRKRTQTAASDEVAQPTKRELFFELVTGKKRPVEAAEEVVSAALDEDLDDMAYLRSKTVKAPPRPTANDDGNDEDDDEKNRVFVSNVAFGCTEEELREAFEEIGAVSEVHASVDSRTKASLGFAFVRFVLSSDARRAVQELNGQALHGRRVRVQLANDQEEEDSSSSSHRVVKRPRTFTEKREAERKARAASRPGVAGALDVHVRPDAAAAVAARRVSAATTQDVFDATSAGDSAVKLALAEAALQAETLDFFLARGFDLNASSASSSEEGDDEDDVKRKRSSSTSSSGEGGASSSSSSSTEKKKKSRSRTALLAKNLPASTTEAELRQLFGAASTAIHLAPNRLVAVVEFGHPTDARAALKRNAYRRFKRSPLYLDWAPLKTQENEPPPPPAKEEEAATPSRTLYVTNVGFDATEADLLGLFRQSHRPLAATLPRQQGGRHKGFGFVDFASAEVAGRALRALQGTFFKGRVLELAFAKQPATDDATTTDAGEEPLRKRGKHPAKLVVRNLAFATTARDLRGLFASFGHLKTVRLPKRFDGRHRGFGFVEFLAHRDAKAAKAALKAAHLYGRHLVIDYADAHDAGLGAAPTRDDHDHETG